MTTRRGFLGAMLAAAAAPAFVKGGVLMPVSKMITTSTGIVVPSGLVLWGDGIHDDTAAMQAFIDGKPVRNAAGASLARVLVGGSYRISQTLVWSQPSRVRISSANFDGRTITGDGPVFHVLPASEGVLRDSYVAGPERGPVFLQEPHAR